MKKHFPRTNSFHKIFNKNTIKISYNSCMKNINYLIVSYKKSILRPKATEYGCNSRKKESCPLQNQCLTPKHIGVVNEATMVNNSDDEKRVYFGASDTTVKEQYRNNTRDFSHKRNSKCTELLKYILQLKRNKKIPSTEWQIYRKVFCHAKKQLLFIVFKGKVFYY